MKLFAVKVMLIFLFTISFTQAKIYQWTDEGGKTHFSDRPNEFTQAIEADKSDSKAKQNELISPAIPEPQTQFYKSSLQTKPDEFNVRIKLNDVQFKDASLQKCVYKSAGTNGYDAIYTDEIKHVTCSNNSSLVGMEHLTSLESLIISNSEIIDLMPISKLTELNFLALEGSNVSDLNALSNLTKLTVLMLPNAHIKNIYPLRGLSKLVLLDLKNNQITSVTDLNSLSGVNSMNLKGNPLNCTQITDLYIEIVKGKGKVTLRLNPISPKCKNEILGRTGDIQKAIEYYEKKIKLEKVLTTQQKKQQINNGTLQQFIYNRDIKGLKDWLQKNDKSLSNLKVAGTPVFMEAMKNHIRQNQTDSFEFLEWLLINGADINGKDESSKTAFYSLYEYGGFNLKDKAILMFLLKNGVDINEVLENKPTILTAALLNNGRKNSGDINLIKELIAMGADINIQDGLGRTPLMCAYGNKNYDVVDYLFEKGADISLRKPIGITLIYQITQDLNSKQKSAIAKLYIRMLFEKGVKFDLNNKYDRSAYETCLKYMPSETIKLNANQVKARVIELPFIDKDMEMLKNRMKVNQRIKDVNEKQKEIKRMHEHLDGLSAKEKIEYLEKVSNGEIKLF